MTIHPLPTGTQWSIHRDGPDSPCVAVCNDRETAALFAASERLREACEACLAYIPGSEVHCWPPGHELKRKAQNLSVAAIAESRRLP